MRNETIFTHKGCQFALLSYWPSKATSIILPLAKNDDVKDKQAEEAVRDVFNWVYRSRSHSQG